MCCGRIAMSQLPTATMRGKLTIPVVVHIVWKEPLENISDEQVLSQIEALNRDFQQKNDQSNIPSEFKPLAANVDIEFCLAKTDPKGKATSGITRTQTSYGDVWAKMATTLSNPTPRRRIYHTILEGHDAWDTQKYLNIWVGKLGNGKAGYSTFPDAIKPEDTDGIVIDPTFFGTVGTAANNAGFNLGRTAVHEIGHYLNLYHPWGSGSTNFDCKGDDFVTDTPVPVEAISGYPTGLVFGCDNKRVITMNFMNFVQDNWMSMFTEGQKQRMLNAIQQYRSSLVNSTACNSVLSADNILIDNVLVYPNPAKNVLNIEFNRENTNETIFQIYDISGRVVQQGVCNNSKNIINIDNLEVGFYQIGINIENHNIIKRFLVIN